MKIILAIALLFWVVMGDDEAEDEWSDEDEDEESFLKTYKVGNFSSIGKTQETEEGVLNDVSTDESSESEEEKDEIPFENDDKESDDEHSESNEEEFHQRKLQETNSTDDAPEEEEEPKTEEAPNPLGIRYAILRLSNPSFGYLSIRQDLRDYFEDLQASADIKRYLKIEETQEIDVARIAFVD